jgi:hypothetical protein
MGEQLPLSTLTRFIDTALAPDEDGERTYAADPGAYSQPGNQPFDVTQPPNSRPLANIWSAEHAYLADPAGSLLVHGGFTPNETYLFDPGSLTWTRQNPTAAERFYSTTLTLADGRLLTLYGSGSKSLEVYDPGTGTWSPPINVPMPAMGHHQYYPWAYLLPGGKIFIAAHTCPRSASTGARRGSPTSSRSRQSLGNAAPAVRRAPPCCSRCDRRDTSRARSLPAATPR